MGPEMMWASHWTTGRELPASFFLIMIGATYALIAVLGVGAYRLLRRRQDDDPAGGA